MYALPNRYHDISYPVFRLVCFVLWFPAGRETFFQWGICCKLMKEYMHVCTETAEKGNKRGIFGRASFSDDPAEPPEVPTV